MLGQRRDADRFGRVMASIEHVQPQLFRIEKGPVLPFAGHVGVEAGRGRLRNHRSSCARHYAHTLHAHWTDGQTSRDSPEHGCQRMAQVLPRSNAFSPDAERGSVVRAELTTDRYAKQAGEDAVIADFRMTVERQMGGVKRDVFNYQSGDTAVRRTDDGP